MLEQIALAEQSVAAKGLTMITGVSDARIAEQTQIARRIHDLTDLHHSLIHINGSVTGREIGKQPATMTTEEKTALVEILERNGALQFKGAVEQIALLAGVSKYTIYNYLEKIHARQAVNHL